MAHELIQPRILKGFRDYLPNVATIRQVMIRTLEGAFLEFGFSPIDTPALEYSEILLGKGSEETDRQLYRFTDNGKRDVSMRFDLTIPLARFVAMHLNELGKPFKRYHIAPVWRAEKPQKGRYREFMQCDFDTVGTTSLRADAEIIALIHHAIHAIGLEHRIKINHRAILNGLLEQIGALDAQVAVLRAIDKLEKLGQEVVSTELEEVAKLSSAQIQQIFSFLALSTNAGGSEEILNSLRDLLSKSALGLSGVEQLSLISTQLNFYGLSDENFELDLSIARGLDYYTGVVFETTWNAVPHIGSICSGGRYDNLVGLYTKQSLPGVGASIGLDRILGGFEELKRLPEKMGVAQVIVTVLDAEVEGQYIKIAQNLRSNGFSVELYTEQTKLAAQLKYANRKGAQWVVIAGAKELEQNVVSIKEMESGRQVDNIPVGEIASHLS